MIIYVNNRPAAIKTGSSFDYVAENRLFLGRDGYSLSITFPLSDCPQNQAIFGMVNRMDMAKPNTQYPCEIRYGDNFLNGTLTVTGVTDKDITAQFSEGRCEQTTTDPFEDTYVNELNLGTPNVIQASKIEPKESWKGFDMGAEAVALPWINESYPDVPNNWASFDSGQYSWDAEVTKLSWQPYLIVIAKRICDEIGYSYDFSSWEKSSYRYLLICNTLPSSWNMPQYAKALPHWTVSEFFEKLELLLMAEFDIDHRAKSIRFRFSADAAAEVASVCIEDVVDSYSVEVSAEDDVRCDYIAAKRLAYKECSYPTWKYLSCDWFMKDQPVVRYETLKDLINNNKKRLVSFNNGDFQSWVWGDMAYGCSLFYGEYGINNILYAKDVDTYFVLKMVGQEKLPHPQFGYLTRRVFALQPVNVFGCGYPDDGSTDVEEIDFVPVCVLPTEDAYGQMMMLSLGTFSEDDTSTDTEDGAFRQTGPITKIDAGEVDKANAYYDTIYVGYWDGLIPTDNKSPYPIVDKVVVNPDWTYKIYSGRSLRLHGNARGYLSSLPQINPRHKLKFSWISSSIPNPRAIFYIRGRRYLCEKITATFTENGMSQLLKGEFFPLADD